MVDLTKWDFISYKDIKVGDRLKVITEGTTNNLNTKTVTTATVDHQGWSAWYSDNIRVTSDPEGKDEHFTVEIYRRKPKPFEFPTNRLAIVRGQRVGHDTVTVNFVKTDSGWYHQSGSDYTVKTIEKYFHSFKVVFAGINE